MKTKTIILLLLTIGLHSKLWAQSGLEKYEKLARNLYAQNNFAAAIEIYERLLFFGDDSYIKNIYLPLARAYTAVGNFDQASVNYTNAYNNAKSDSMRYEIVFEGALNYILDGDTVLAYTELLNIPESGTSENVYNKLHMLMGTLDYKSGRYTTAKYHFLKLKGLDKNSEYAIETLFKKTKKTERRYNPAMVEWMSIVPGLGQAWCGYYKESANAFLLTGAFVALFIDVSIKYRALDGILVVYPWLNRYYKGGIKKSYGLAEKKREVEKNKLFNNFLKSIPPIN